MKLRRVGFYKEMLYGNKNDPSILKFIREKGELEEGEICNYLEQGIVLVACGGVVKDIINPNNGFAGCPDMLTDGIWVWSGDLTYYIKKYHLELERDFIQTMKDNDWQIKSVPDANYDDLEIV